MNKDKLHNIKVKNLSVKLLDINDTDDIHSLFSNCNDYFVIEQGVPATAEDAKNLLEALPPKRTYDDKYVIGFYKEKTELVALVDIVRDFPEDGTWMLGLLLIDPSQRRTGLGNDIHEALTELVRGEDGVKIRVGVIENNHVGMKFWKAQSYTLVKTVEMDNGNGQQSVHVMSLDV